MKLQKEITDTSIFEKKKTNLQTFKEKLIQYKDLSSYFNFWGYNLNDSEIKDSLPNFLACGFFSIPPTVGLFLLLENYIMLLPALALALFADGAAISYIRSLKFGLSKNRYKKWKFLKNEVETVTQDNNLVFSLLLETESSLKNLQQQVVENQELKTLINKSIEKLIEELKEIFATYENSVESIDKLIEKFNEIQHYQEEMLKAIKTYQLKNEYVDYKKANGIIEDDTEKQSVESNIIRDFKAIL